MHAALVFVIALSAGEPDASLSAMADATREMLGEGARVVFETPTQLPNDAEVLAMGETQHAQAVVEVLWQDSAHNRARLRVHTAKGEDWVERDIAFSAGDARAERGRTLGLAVGSMVSAEVERTESDGATTDRSLALPVTHPVDGLSTRSPEASPAQVSRPSNGESRAAPSAPSERVFAASLATMGVLGLDTRRRPLGWSARPDSAPSLQFGFARLPRCAQERSLPVERNWSR